MTDIRDDLQDQFFYLANQYYAIAKFAMAVMLHPVCGTQFHHAIELYLKGALCLRIGEARRKALGHHLDALWSEFKSLENNPELAHFDNAVNVLDKFEDIRYPERILEEGMQFVLSLQPINSEVIEKYDGQSVPHYILPFDQMSSLVRVVIKSTGKDPEHVLRQITPGGYAELKKGFELRI